MAVPKRRHSSTRGKKRRTHWKLQAGRQRLRPLRQPQAAASHLRELRLLRRRRGHRSPDRVTRTDRRHGHGPDASGSTRWAATSAPLSSCPAPCWRSARFRGASASCCSVTKPRSGAPCSAGGADGLPIEVVHAPERVEMAEKPALAVRRKTALLARRATRSRRKARSTRSSAPARPVRSWPSRCSDSAGSRACRGPRSRRSSRTPAAEPWCSTSAPMPSARPRTWSSSPRWDRATPATCWGARIRGSACSRSARRRPRAARWCRRRVPLLRRASHLNFIGNVEGRRPVRGDVDVVVTDGFTGNVVLKLAESVAGRSRTRCARRVEARRCWRRSVRLSCSRRSAAQEASSTGRSTARRRCWA